MKFIVVSKTPEDLHKNAYIVTEPDYTKEIEACSRKKPRNNQTTVNYLREILAQIGNKYVGHEFDAILNVNLANYVGVPFKSAVDVQKVLKEALSRSYPQMVDRYLEHHVKARPFGTKLIYFIGDRRLTSKLFELGFEEIKEKDIDECLGIKQKQEMKKPGSKSLKTDDDSK